jgi:hypothetical protein
MKSSRLRSVSAGGHAMPSVQMFPLCIGGWCSRILQVGWPVSRLVDCAATIRHTASFWSSKFGFPLGSGCVTVQVCSQATTTCPGSPAAIDGK